MKITGKIMIKATRKKHFDCSGKTAVKKTTPKELAITDYFLFIVTVKLYIIFMSNSGINWPLYKSIYLSKPSHNQVKNAEGCFENICSYSLSVTLT